jgi:7,8-dihydro-6-hydroxymethylpterin-pyrophosphokinase
LIINAENLKIPHPQIKNRLFVVKPLLEILDHNHTEFNQLSVRELELNKKDSLKKIDIKNFY